MTARNLVQINFPETPLQYLKAATRQQEIMENQHKHCKIITCRFGLDIGPGTAVSTVESDSTFVGKDSSFHIRLFVYNFCNTLNSFYFRGVTYYLFTSVNFVILI